ncbi:hypothetical protein HOD05_00765 [Candidatus Woesearchaeota archaeon]|jgi:hypothetical protein|nr:hypothetical protein [Candidatus Woesearchaeota archaeon]MBT4150938.1 hypothetical protein [Candidatus Woesearchaeota archaeon]MBT4247087.1 hypothetical protein [Candidatus Woesearchaeota archaeon]MBT4433728.1 hypothetical protein [Candidatus Woesearchaeota archaeon]MBT7332263.1 hypothetical protein [Candidatus Woesearchaeota archaeon]
MKFISPGRTGDVEEAWIKGRKFYAKTNPSKRVTDIEARIYAGLREEGIRVPEIYRVDDVRILVEDAGINMADQMVNGGYEKMRSKAQVLNLVKTRTSVNKIIGKVLTNEEKNDLELDQKEKLRNSINKLAGRDLSIKEIEINYWACRALSAMGIYDEQFMQNYTHTIGKKLDELCQTSGQWVGDNNLWNNASIDGITQVPFDFNSIRYAPSQVDLAAVTGLYLFHGFLGVCKNHEERTELIDEIRKISAPEMNPKDYFTAFMIATLHKNTVIAGYRLQATKEGLEICKKRIHEGRKMAFVAAFKSLKKTFSEIDYHSSVAALVEREHGNIVFEDPQKGSQISRFIVNKTFGQRLPIFMDPVWELGEQMDQYYL